MVFKIEFKAWNNSCKSIQDRIRNSVKGYVRRVERVTEFVKGKIEGFTPREKVERVRNCTKIGSDIINEIGERKFWRRIKAK